VSVIDQASGERWNLYNADTVDVARGLPAESVGLSVFSPPFASLYTYSDSPRDFGNSSTYEDFWEMYAFLVAETMRVMKPGGTLAIHCMDLPTSKTRDGYIGLRDFPGDIIRAYQKAGFVYHSRITIWTDPVTAMQRTKAIGLLHKQLRKDSSMSRQGIPDTVIVMRKPGDRVPPVAHAHEAGDVFGETRESIDAWQRYASPVWVTTGEEAHPGFLDCHPDIDRSDTLNARSAREEKDEAHLCPLQLEVIRRCVRLWSHRDDVVWSPFAGIGSEGYVALQEGRRFIGAELKSSYYRQAKKNLQAASAPKQPTLFEVTQ